MTAALGAWRAAVPGQQHRWATAYADALAKAPGRDPAKVPPGPTGRSR